VEIEGDTKGSKEGVKVTDEWRSGKRK